MNLLTLLPFAALLALSSPVLADCCDIPPPPTILVQACYVFESDFQVWGWANWLGVSSPEQCQSNVGGNFSATAYYDGVGNAYYFNAATYEFLSNWCYDPNNPDSSYCYFPDYHPFLY